ncbi:hypothetical protein [Pimelobacter sp. 30-1]|uniref:hypothetical protein n=1 Tax=Pimelobacter sp. 30-1 TaxID=2004991 RepID=UPI001C03BB9E|nr:hypothetical protein [Pimelobacter sp. 30-1]MBU2698920.1 hypothetical protein [Pimelobacter sp. 30-1]
MFSAHAHRFGGGRWKRRQTTDFDAVALTRLTDLLDVSVGSDDVHYLVVCRDQRTGTASYIGPYRERLEALAAAVQEQSAQDPTGRRLCFDVAPVRVASPPS